MAVKKENIDQPTIVEGHAVTLVDEPSTTENTSATSSSSSSSSIGPATVAGGVIGFLLGGPLVGLILGIGSGYASTRQGAAGDIARASGDIAVNVREKATEINEEHQLTRKFTDGVRRICNFIGNRRNDRGTRVPQDDFTGN